MPTPKVAIVGAGLSGLTALKHCLEERFEPVLFETKSYIGGQWHYELPDPVTGETESSIYNGVLLNSCRDTSAFSDFPMDPARYPDYFGHEAFLRYLEEYVEYFGLEKYICFNTKVVSCTPEDGGKWKVTTESQGQDPVEDVYDAIFACTGSLTIPAIPKFDGLEKFQGEVFHSRYYRQPTGFEGKRIAIIGLGNSAADISSELCAQAKELHIITRRGSWIIPRYAFGKPVEAFNSRMAEAVLPFELSQWCQTQVCNHVMGNLPETIQPDHGLLEAHITLRSELLENIKTHRITPHRAGVKSISETSILLDNDTSIDVDVIICCTGYYMDIPYVPKETYRVKHSEVFDIENAMDLYQLVASPRFPNLYFIGFVELAGPLIPVVEAQARWATSVLSTRVHLPSVKEMYKSIAEYQALVADRMVSSDRHTVTVRYLPYCDSLMKDIGAQPTMFRMFINMFHPSLSKARRAARLFRLVYFGMNSAAQYRIFGHGGRPDLAAATILRIAEEDDALSKEERKYLEKYQWKRKKA